jgi:hypothetical protein
MMVWRLFLIHRGSLGKPLWLCHPPSGTEVRRFVQKEYEVLFSQLYHFLDFVYSSIENLYFSASLRLRGEKI